MWAYYARSVKDFLSSSPDTILSALVAANSQEFSNLESTQVDAWREEVAILQHALLSACHRLRAASAWSVLLEFTIPRRQRRIDAVILAGDIICVLEFKTGMTGQSKHGARQVEDYALELADFHSPSRNRTIVPIVVAHGCKHVHVAPRPDWVQAVKQAAPHELSTVLVAAFKLHSVPDSQSIDCSEWERGQYRPVPTIIEAATALYAGASVREITHSHSGVENLSRTTNFVLKAIEKAQKESWKLICFITGIPGAGKTLAGLNLVHDPQIRGDGRDASVFMSGNGPLVEILREALAIDCATRTGTSKKDARRKVSAFVQNIHHFVRDNLEREDSHLECERVIIFDEAQRAWNAERNRKKHRKRSAQWHTSEPGMVLRIMDRHTEWAVVVALVGGGQEIHEGEAGLVEWGRALESTFGHWHVLASPEALDGGDSVAGGVLFRGGSPRLHVTPEPVLHLKTCVRSYRAEALAFWVNRVLSGNAVHATETIMTFDRFPVVITRDLGQMKDWLRFNTRGTRRCGLVASSGATRLRAVGIETSQASREAHSYPHWFLAPQGDVRSSYQLETVATEFEIQGLELDNVGLCWGGDLTWSRESRSWTAAKFVGTRWKTISPGELYTRTLNKYRVLLTRARQGLIIWIPRGDPNDPTRSTSAMDHTFEYLVACGCTVLDSAAIAATAILH